MRLILALAALLLTATQAFTANVDEAAARAQAQRFLNTLSAQGKMTAPAQGDLKIAHIERNTGNLALPVYYIFNSEQGFIIVSGDDRAQAILAHGDRPLDVNSMPENMKYWLSTYKRQLEFLQAHPGLVVDMPKSAKNLKLPTSIAPLLTAEWDQDEPYFNHCPVYDGTHCLTGCPATSLSMVFYYWKYPKDPTPEVPAYISSSINTMVPALPSITFDWDNMLDKYTGNYTTTQADAVAWLMRYVGQVEHMDYNVSISGAQAQDILRAVKFFGYDEDAEVVYKAIADNFGNETPNYTDEEWAEMLQTELSEGRPLVYCAYDYDSWTGWSGHAFNVDGYNTADNTYHVNWGWSGNGNGDFALNAFYHGGLTFNIEQAIIKGLQPPVTTPTIRVVPTQLDLSAYAEQTATASFTVKGKALTGDVSLELNDENGVFSLDATSFTPEEIKEAHEVIVTYSPMFSGNHEATVTLSSPGAEDVVITLHGASTLETYAPVMLPADSAYINLTSFRADWTDLTAAKYVDSYTLEVNTKPGTTLIDQADWSGNVEDPTNYSNNPDFLMPEGWTFEGSAIWSENASISINNRSSLITPVYDLAGYEKVTVVVTAKSISKTSSSKFTISTGTDSYEVTCPGGTEFKTYVVELNCEEMDQLTFAGTRNYPQFQKILIYAGELDENSLRDVVEEGDASSRLVTGITGKNYTVDGLTAGGTFYYRVKAHYVDGTSSDWTKSEKITLFENTHNYERGDVNHDGSINISDVVALINGELSGGGYCDICCDVNGDGTVSISDVTTLINLVLSGH